MVDTIHTRAKKTGHDGLSIYIPKDLKVDSKNPIHSGDDISITVDGQKMVIEKIDVGA
ncbi:MAG: hypothetical protein HF975_04350 [ANME-2 cluster archaeon]|nr:hypothetical protein [ANME-2 cluster archaeon]